MAMDWKDISPLPYASNKEYELHKSIDKHNQYHTLRYDFKPASVNSDQPAELELTQSGQVTIKAPNVAGSSSNITVFRGQRRPHVKECLLVIDNRTGEMVLQKLTDNITVKATRTLGGGTTTTSSGNGGTSSTTSGGVGGNGSNNIGIGNSFTNTNGLSSSSSTLGTSLNTANCTSQNINSNHTSGSNHVRASNNHHQSNHHNSSGHHNNNNNNNNVNHTNANHNHNSNSSSNSNNNVANDGPQLSEESSSSSDDDDDDDEDDSSSSSSSSSSSDSQSGKSSPSNDGDGFTF